MADNKINAHCSICNEGYFLCKSCKNEKKFKPWRTVTDTIEHYKIYMAIHGYTVTKNKEQAKSELQNCNLSDIDSFKPEIKSVIQEIMSEPVKVKPVSKTRKNKADVDLQENIELGNKTIPESEE